MDRTHITTMEDIDAMVFVLLGLVLFVRHKREESQRRLHAARQNTLEKSRRVLEYNSVKPKMRGIKPPRKDASRCYSRHNISVGLGAQPILGMVGCDCSRCCVDATNCVQFWSGKTPISADVCP
ncbi:unnamed protein product [Arctogadus glacialis]